MRGIKKPAGGIILNCLTSILQLLWMDAKCPKADEHVQKVHNSKQWKHFAENRTNEVPNIWH